MMEMIHTSETLVLKRTIECNVPEDGIRHSSLLTTQFMLPTRLYMCTA
jgi:hypothetical protein